MARDHYDGNGHGPVLPGAPLHMPGGLSMAAQGAALRYQLHVLRRRWWLVALVALTVVGGAWWRARNQIPLYTAELQMRKEPKRELEAGWAGFYDLTPEAINAEIQIVKSQGVLEPVVDSMGARLVFDLPSIVRGRIFSHVAVQPAARPGAYQLRRNGNEATLIEITTRRQLDAAAPGELLLGPGFIVRIASLADLEDPINFRILSRDEAVGRLRDDLKVEQLRNTMILSVKYTNPDPQYSAALANEVGRQYAWYSGKRARQDATQRKEILADRLGTLADSLMIAQQQIRQVDQMPVSSGVGASAADLSRQLIGLNDDLKKTEYKLKRLQDVRAALQRNPEQGMQWAVAMGDDLPGSHQAYANYLNLRQVRLTTIQTGNLTPEAPEVKRVDAEIADAIREVARLTNAVISQTEGQLVNLQGRLGEVRQDLVTVTSRMSQTDALRQEAEALQQVYLALSGKYYEAQISERLEASEVDIISNAIPPAQPDTTRTTRSFFFAMIVGLMLGVLAALVLEQMDTRVRDAEDAQRAASVGVIGMIPELRGDSGRPLAIRHDDHTLGAEAYRKLRTNLRFLRAERPRVISVTSPSPDEGKSVTAANLALAIAQQGQDVLIIDADLRRPVQHEIFGVPRAAGLSDALVGLVDPLDVIVAYDELPNLSIMNCGTEAPNPAELLGSDAFARLLSTLIERFDTVIVDTPPVNLVTDAAVISSVTDGVILVAEAGRTDRSVLASAVNELRQARGSVLGIVLNRVAPGGRYGRYGGYYSGRMYYRREAESGTNGDRLTAIKDWVSALI